jgi:hypothetical protein
MLSLNSPRWTELRHAYGSASDIPRLLRQLDTFPISEGTTEPWFSLWSALAHQGDVYSASFAAVPHVIEALSTDPLKASFDYFHFPAWVEICRYRKNIAVPEDLNTAYSIALARLPKLVCAASERPWDEDFLLCALAAMAVSKGAPKIAEAVLELTPDTITEFRNWLDTR